MTDSERTQMSSASTQRQSRSEDPRIEETQVSQPTSPEERTQMETEGATQIGTPHPEWKKTHNDDDPTVRNIPSIQDISVTSAVPLTLTQTSHSLSAHSQHPASFLSQETQTSHRSQPPSLLSQKTQTSHHRNPPSLVSRKTQASHHRKPPSLVSQKTQTSHHRNPPPSSNIPTSQSNKTLQSPASSPETEADSSSEWTDSDSDYEEEGDSTSRTISGSSSSDYSGSSRTSSRTSASSASSGTRASSASEASRRSGEGGAPLLQTVATQSGTERAERRWTILVRSGERVDRIFPNWLRDSFTTKGLYIPTDTNLPTRLPRRSQGLAGYIGDGPITEMGQITSQVIGRALRMKRGVPDIIMASPALRCVQTAHNIRRLTRKEATPLCIEPGLFEWTGWYDGVPSFMSPEELKRAGYSVREKYRPVVSLECLRKRMKDETIPDLYDRIQKTVRSLVEDVYPSASILFVGHAVTLDAGARELMRRGRKDLPSEMDINRLGLHYPYNTSVVLAPNPHSPHRWTLKNQHIPHIQYLDFSNHVNTTFLTR